MGPGQGETVNWRRLRWRLRGAWQWPTFLGCLMADALLLQLLPPAGQGAPLPGAFLLAGFLNLVGVAVLAPMGGHWLRRRRADLPRVVASDYAGTAALLACTAVLAGLGLAHRPALDARERAFAAQSQAFRRYVGLQAPLEFRRNIDRADTIRLGENFYRTCVTGQDRTRALCLYLDTAQSPPGVRRDTNPIPNARYLDTLAARGTGN